MSKSTIVDGIRTLSIDDSNSSVDESLIGHDTRTPAIPKKLGAWITNKVHIVIEEPSAELRAELDAELEEERAARASRPWEELGCPIFGISRDVKTEPVKKPGSGKAKARTSACTSTQDQSKVSLAQLHRELLMQSSYSDDVGRSNLEKSNRQRRTEVMESSTDDSYYATYESRQPYAGGASSWNATSAFQSDDDIEWRNLHGRPLRIGRPGYTPPPGLLSNSASGFMDEENRWEPDGLPTEETGFPPNLAMWDEGSLPSTSTYRTRILDALESKTEVMGNTRNNPQVQESQPTSEPEILEGGWRKVQVTIEDEDRSDSLDDKEQENNSKELPYAYDYDSDTDDGDETDEEIGGNRGGAHRHPYSEPEDEEESGGGKDTTGANLGYPAMPSGRTTGSVYYID